MGCPLLGLLKAFLRSPRGLGISAMMLMWKQGWTCPSGSSPVVFQHVVLL